MTWTWAVSGTARSLSPGAMVRYVDDSGTVEADGHGEAMAELLQHGPFWELLDHEEAITITLTPLEDEVQALADGVVASLLLQSHAAAAPGDL